MNLSPLVPFEPVNTNVFPAGDSWIAQIKWDGVRILTYKDGETVKLINRKLHDRTGQYPELVNTAEYASADSFILDGEVISLTGGKPSFHDVMRRDGLRKLQNLPVVRRQVPVTYMIFDILYCNGEWVADRPLRERQELLQQVVRPNETVQLVANFPDPEELFRVVRDHGLEGIVVKDLDSKYLVGGKDKRWMKKKVIQDLIAVVGGVTKRSGTVNALLLGLYDEKGQLWYIGHAGTGKLTQEDWRGITRMAETLAVEERPFINAPERMKDACWLQPNFTVKINYLEWTPGRSLRQPSIQAVLKTPPAECTFNQNSSGYEEKGESRS